MEGKKERWENEDNYGVLIKYKECGIPADIITKGIKPQYFNAWFVLQLKNLRGNACTLTSDYHWNDFLSKCILKVKLTHCGHSNSTDLYEIILDQNLESRERRGLEEVPSWRSRLDRVGNILDELNYLLKNDSLSISSDGVHSVFDKVDDLLSIERKDEIPGELLHGLDKLGTRFKLKDNHKGSLVRNNIAVLVADVTPTLQLRGMRIAAGEKDVFAEDALDLITDEAFPQMTSDKNEAAFLLPDSALVGERRISLVAFRTNRSFINDHNSQLNSKVLSINVDNFKEFQDGEMISIYLNPWVRVHPRDQSRACASWNFHENGTGFWSQEGCTLYKSHQEGVLDLCQCNHLTHFAEILIRRNVFPEIDESILSMISVVGCSFSLFGISIIAMTAALFKSWRQNDSNKIWLHLCSAVFILDVCFLVTVFVEFDEQVVSCVAVGVILHYSVLATFCWMMIISILSYRKLVLVFNSELPCKLLVAAAFAWGFPILVIGILFAVNPRAYSMKFEEMTPSGKFCYPKGAAFWAAVFGPIAAMWLVNWILYAIILRTMFKSKKRIRRHSSTQDTLRCASVSCLLAFLCGIPWIFGFFAYNIVAAYLFSITVTLQGFVMFLFFILANKKTRGLWIGLFSRNSKRATLITSTERSNKDTNTARFAFLSSSISPLDQASGSLLAESRL